jgi:hypothetical protein
VNEKFVPVLVDMKYYKEIQSSIVSCDNYLFDLSSTENEYEKEINLLFRSPHYDTLYKSHFVNKINSNYPNNYSCLIEGQFDESEYHEYRTNLFKKINQEKSGRNPLSQLLASDKGKRSQSSNQNNNIKNISIQPIVIDLTNVNLNDDQGNRVLVISTHFF